MIDESGMGDNIYLMGRTTDVKDALSHAKAFIMTSDYEGMPNSLLEAMAVGLPCIATDCHCGGTRAVIDNYKNGILIHVGEEDELFDALIKLQGNKKLRDAFSINAKRTANRFSPEVIFQNWKKLVESKITSGV